MTSLKKQEELKLLKMNYEGKVTFIFMHSDLFFPLNLEVTFMEDSYIHLCEPSLTRMFEFTYNQFVPVYSVLDYFGISRKLDKVLLITVIYVNPYKIFWQFYFRIKNYNCLIFYLILEATKLLLPQFRSSNLNIITT